MSSTVPVPSLSRPVLAGPGDPSGPGPGLSDGTVQC
jgi:hypothetical protein